MEGGGGTVPAEVREMLDEHSMTKTDGPKKRGQLNMSPLSEEGGEVGGVRGWHLLHALKQDVKHEEGPAGRLVHFSHTNDNNNKKP